MFQRWTPAVLACSSRPPQLMCKPLSGVGKKMRQAGAGLPLMVNMGCFTEARCKKKKKSKDEELPHDAVVSA